MALYDGTNAPLIKVYLDVGNRNAGKFILNYSLLGGSDTLGSYTPFTTLQQMPSTDVKRISIRRGRTREDQAIQPGDLTLVLDNTSGNYDPEFTIASTITAASGNGSVITYTYSSATPYKAGMIVTIYGLSNANFNLSYQTIVSATSTTFTVANGYFGSTSSTGAAYSGFVNGSGQTMLVSNSGIRVTATWSGVEYNLYSGFIEQMDKDLSLEPTVTITCVDGSTQLGKSFVNTDVSTLGDVDAITKILADAGWNGSLAGSPGSYYYLGKVPTDTAQSMIDIISGNQMGMFFINGSNEATWLNWNVFKPTGSSKTAKFTLSDARTSTDLIEYDSISVIGGEKYLLNTVIASNYDSGYVAGNDPAIITEFNSASVGRFGPVQKEVDLYINATTLQPTAAQDAVQALADAFASPVYRVDEVSFECVGFSSTLWYNFLNSCELSQVVDVVRSPIYGGTLTYNSYIQQITHDITPDSWRSSLTLSPVK